MKLIPIGFGSYISLARLVAAVDPDSNPIKRVVSQAKDDGKLIDATYGRKTEAVLMMDNGAVILCPLTPEEVAARASAGEKEGGHES